MSELSRNFARRFLGVCLIWFVFAPLIALPSLVGCVLAVAALISFILAQWRRHPWLAFAFSACYVICIGLLLWLSFGDWVLPPAWCGIGVVFSLAGIWALSPRQTLKSDKKITSLKMDKPLALSRFYGLYLTWGLGIAMAAIIQSVYAPIILFGWTCLMLITANSFIWPYAQSPEWLGYSTRRECFVSANQWRFRFALAIVICLVWAVISIRLGLAH